VRAIQVLSVLMILVGLLLAFNLLSLATIVIDDTAPLIEATQSQPQIGATYTMLTEVFLACKDEESSISSVTCSLDGAPPFTLTYDQTTADGWQIFRKTLNAPITSAGSHTFDFTVKNKAGLTNGYGGSFTIYTQLQGRWFINDQEILSQLQTFYFTTRTLTFKFSKTQGGPDNTITCTVKYQGPESGTLTLSNSAANTWTATKTFKAGQYTMTLEATDGLVVIRMATLQLNVDYTPPPAVSLSQLLGIGLIAVGAVLAFKKRW